MQPHTSWPVALQGVKPALEGAASTTPVTSLRARRRLSAASPLVAAPSSSDEGTVAADASSAADSDSDGDAPGSAAAAAAERNAAVQTSSAKLKRAADVVEDASNCSSDSCGTDENMAPGSGDLPAAAGNSAAKSARRCPPGASRKWRDVSSY